MSFGRVSWAPPGVDPKTLEVTVTPMMGDGGTQLGTVVLFADVTEHARLDEEHERSQRQLETAYEEPIHGGGARDHERGAPVEQRGARDDERGAPVGQQGLETLSRDQGHRSEELDRVNMFLDGILGNLGIGVAVVDRDQLVQVWNESSTDLWGVRSDEVEGRPLSTCRWTS